MTEGKHKMSLCFLLNACLQSRNITCRIPDNCCFRDMQSTIANPQEPDSSREKISIVTAEGSLTVQETGIHSAQTLIAADVHQYVAVLL